MHTLSTNMMGASDLLRNQEINHRENKLLHCREEDRQRCFDDKQACIKSPKSSKKRPEKGSRHYQPNNDSSKHALHTKNSSQVTSETRDSFESWTNEVYSLKTRLQSKDELMNLERQYFAKEIMRMKAQLRRSNALDGEIRKLSGELSKGDVTQRLKASLHTQTQFDSSLNTSISESDCLSANIDCSEDVPPSEVECIILRAQLQQSKQSMALLSEGSRSKNQEHEQTLRHLNDRINWLKNQSSLLIYDKEKYKKTVKSLTIRAEQAESGASKATDNYNRVMNDLEKYKKSLLVADQTNLSQTKEFHEAKAKNRAATKLAQLQIHELKEKCDKLECALSTSDTTVADLQQQIEQKALGQQQVLLDLQEKLDVADNIQRNEFRQFVQDMKSTVPPDQDVLRSWLFKIDKLLESSHLEGSRPAHDEANIPDTVEKIVTHLISNQAQLLSAIREIARAAYWLWGEWEADSKHIERMSSNIGHLLSLNHQLYEQEDKTELTGNDHIPNPEASSTTVSRVHSPPCRKRDRILRRGKHKDALHLSNEG